MHGYTSFKLSQESLACSLLFRYNFQKRNFDFYFVRVRDLITTIKGKRRLSVLTNELQGKILGLRGKK